MPHVMQEWTANIPLKEQGVLVLALRGPDGIRKEHGAKNIVRAIRGSCMTAGVTGKPLVPGEDLPNDNFMEMYRVGCVEEDPWKEAVTEFFREWDVYNVHFVFHLLHAAAVLGIRHPVPRVRHRWWGLYIKGMHAIHANPETPGQVVMRLASPITGDQYED